MMVYIYSYYYCVQIFISEVSIDDIKRELSSFDGPSDQTYPRRRRKIKPEDKPPWVPPLWQQQYENIRKMRAKRDAPVDKYGCFMNAERDVLPEASLLSVES